MEPTIILLSNFNKQLLLIAESFSKLSKITLTVLENINHKIEREGLSTYDIKDFENLCSDIDSLQKLLAPKIALIESGKIEKLIEDLSQDSKSIDNLQNINQGVGYLRQLIHGDENEGRQHDQSEIENKSKAEEEIQREWESTLNMFSNQLENRENRIKSLKEELKTSDIANEDLTNTIRSLLGKNTSLEIELAKVKQEVNELKSHNKEPENFNQELRQEVDEMKSSNQELRLEDELKSSNEELKSSNQELKQEIDR